MPYFKLRHPMLAERIADVRQKRKIILPGQDINLPFDAPKDAWLCVVPFPVLVNNRPTVMRVMVSDDVIRHCCVQLPTNDEAEEVSTDAN